jgi:ribosome-binding ATPase YchF (GTP1/OBG family)
MALNAGIIGLPNAGKTTIFNLMTSGAGLVSSIPFTTVVPLVGAVFLDDPRLSVIAGVFSKEQYAASPVMVTDTAALSEGAHRGEGLGNQFLRYLSSCDFLFHVVRCFKNHNVEHFGKWIDPVSDVLVVNRELIKADLEFIESETGKNDEIIQGKRPGDLPRAKMLRPLLRELSGIFSREGIPRGHYLHPEDRRLVETLPLMTNKPVVFICNIDDHPSSRDLAEKVAAFALRGNFRTVIVAPHSLTSEERTCGQTWGLDIFYTLEGGLRAWPFLPPLTIQSAICSIHPDLARLVDKPQKFHCPKSGYSAINILSTGKPCKQDDLVSDGDAFAF